MSNYQKERICRNCGKITKKRKHIQCPLCGGVLSSNNKISNNAKPIITSDAIYYSQTTAEYPIIDY